MDLHIVGYDSAKYGSNSVVRPDRFNRSAYYNIADIIMQKNAEYLAYES